MIKYYNVEKLKQLPSKEFVEQILGNINHSSGYVKDDREIFDNLKDSDVYSITVIIDILKPELRSKKEYAKREEIPISSKYTELLYEYFFTEFGEEGGHDIYKKYLDKYLPQTSKNEDVDEIIMEKELEPRYKDKILKRFKNIEKLKKPRKRIKRERYYELPPPLNRVDWRNPYDNIFVWTQDGEKYCVRGGNGSSMRREMNSKFIYGFSRIDQIRPITSYLFLYNNENKLYFLRKFKKFAVPRYDIGSNYHLPKEESERILSETNLLEWKDDMIKTRSVKVYYR